MPTSETLLRTVGDIGDNVRNVRDLWDLRQRLIPFVGAGLSMQHQYPSWGQLVQSLLKAPNGRNDDLQDSFENSQLLTEVKALLRFSRYEEAASAVFDSLAPKDVRERIDEQLNETK